MKIPITHIVNRSIENNVMPDDFKLARVCPLYKQKGSKNNAYNYRPVSTLTVTSKVLERAVYIQLEEYLTSKTVLFEFQSAFRGHYFTDTCLIYIFDYIKSQIYQGNYVSMHMVLLNLQKVFDTVDHGILCVKLSAMGIESMS